MDKKTQAAPLGCRKDVGLVVQVPRHSRALREEIRELPGIGTVCVCIALVSQIGLLIVLR